MTEETIEWRGVVPEAKAFLMEREGDDHAREDLDELLYRAVAHGVRLEQGQVDGATLDADAIERGAVTEVDGPAPPPTEDTLGGGVTAG